MKKTPVNNYQYLEFLVRKIKVLHKEKVNFDWYFDQLIALYNPLIQSSARKIYKKFKSRVSFLEVRDKIVVLFFDSILRYEPNFSDKTKDTNNFTYVYFSNYLKRKLPWDLMRLYQPTKIEHDDLSVDPRHVELDHSKANPELQKKFVYTNTNLRPISENFIYLCKHANKELYSDFLADVMILHFGYGYKNNEIASFFETTPLKIHNALGELKKYWKANQELINP